MRSFLVCVSGTDPGLVLFLLISCQQGLSMFPPFPRLRRRLIPASYARRHAFYTRSEDSLGSAKATIAIVQRGLSQNKPVRSEAVLFSLAVAGSLECYQLQGGSEYRNSASKVFDPTCHSDTNHSPSNARPPGPKWYAASQGSVDTLSQRASYLSVSGTGTDYRTTWY